MSTTKAELASLLQILPDDCTLEDGQYHLYALAKVRVGLDRTGTGPCLKRRSRNAFADGPPVSLVPGGGG
jgi:hypothetical protein